MKSIWKVFSVLLPYEKSYPYTYHSSYTWRQGESTCVWEYKLFLVLTAALSEPPPSHYTLPFSPTLKARVCSSDDTHLFPISTPVLLSTPVSPAPSVQPSPLVIGCSEKLCDLLSCHYYRAPMRTASAGASQAFSPFSDCHQVFRRLWAKVVTTFSMVWLTWLLSSSYILLESHTKHFFSSWRTQSAESVKGSLRSNYKDNI